MDIRTGRFAYLTARRSPAHGTLFVPLDGPQQHSWLSKLGNMQGENASVRSCIAIILATNGHHCLKRLPSPAGTSGSISFHLRPMRESSCVRCANVPSVLNSIFCHSTSRISLSSCAQLSKSLPALPYGFRSTSHSTT